MASLKKKAKSGDYVLRLTREEYLGLTQLLCCNVTGGALTRLKLDDVVNGVSGYRNPEVMLEYKEATADGVRVSKDVVGRGEYA